VTVINGTSVENEINVGKGPSSGLYDPSSGAVDVLVAYPGGSGFAGYVATLGTLGPVATAGTIGYPSVSLTNGFQQAVVSWTDHNEASSSFQWGTSRTYGLPVPQLSGTTVNLNALNAGTLYFFKITDTEANGTKYWETGSFRTVDAPLNEFVGWVWTLVSNPREIVQTGSTLSGARVWVNAVCPYAVVGNGIVDPHQLNFTPTVTNASGGYTLGFPQYVAYNITYPGGITTYTYSLSSSGVCTATDAGNHPTYTNSHDTLYANTNGYWNATQWVSSVLTTTNDYQEFGLPPNGINHTEAAIGFVHTPLVECNVTVINGGSQTIDSYIGGSGSENIQDFEEILGASPSYGDESWDTVSYHSTGIYNDSTGTIVNAWTFGPPTGVGTNGFTPYIDPDPSPPSGSTVWTSGRGNNVFGLYDGGSYTSTSGIDMSIGVSVGFSFLQGSISVPVQYTTASTVSSVHELVCTAESPPAGYDYQFWVYWDPSVESNDQAVNIHVWFDDECAIGSCVG